MSEIKNLFLRNQTYFYATSGVTPPGLQFLKLVDESLQNLLGLNSPNSCCNPSTPSSGQVLSWNTTTKKAEWVSVSGGGLGTNITNTPNPTGITLVSSTGTGSILPLATNLNAGLISPLQNSTLNSLVLNGLLSSQSVVGNGLSASPFKLNGDLLNPGVTMYYGTNGSGVKGWYSLPSGGTASNLGSTLSPTNFTVTNSNGTGLVIPLADATNSGLLSPTQSTKLSNLSGTNTGDVTKTDTGSITHTLVGQNLSSTITGITAATVGQIPSKGAGDTIVWTTLSGGTPSNLALGTTTATTQPITNSNGTGFTLPLSTTTLAGLQSPTDTAKLSNITITQPVDLDAIEQDVADLTTLSGQPSNAINYGTTFTGTTIPDNSNTTTALQALETAVELKQNIITIQEEGISTGSPNPTVVNFVGAATATQVGNTVTVTIPNSSGVPPYSAGAGAIVKASGLGIVFNRVTASVWTFTIPAGVELYSHNIYSIASENPGANVTINYNYASNTVTNQGFSTANPPDYAAFNMSAGSNQQVVIGGTATSAFRPSINTASGGNIQMLITMGTGIGVNETLIKGTFQ